MLRDSIGKELSWKLNGTSLILIPWLIWRLVTRGDQSLIPISTIQKFQSLITRHKLLLLIYVVYLKIFQTIKSFRWNKAKLEISKVYTNRLQKYGVYKPHISYQLSVISSWIKNKLRSRNQTCHPLMHLNQVYSHIYLKCLIFYAETRIAFKHWITGFTRDLGLHVI